VTLDVPDRLAVADLVHLYAAAVDDRRFDDVVALFTDTAELWLPDPPRALEPVRRHHGQDGVRTALAAVAVAALTPPIGGSFVAKAAIGTFVAAAAVSATASDAEAKTRPRVQDHRRANHHSPPRRPPNR